MVKVGEKIVWRIVDGEALILDTHTGDYYSLNEIGTEIWSQLNKGIERAAVAKFISEHYDVDATTVAQDIDALISEFQAQKLIG